MRIVYVLEAIDVAGGVKVVVEHAAELASRGHDVSIVARSWNRDWIDVAVPVRLVPELTREYLPDADVFVATWYATVLPALASGRARRVVHFSQGYEAAYSHFAHLAPEVEAAYLAPVPKLVISPHVLRWLEGRFPGPFHVVPQAIRHSDFEPGPERSRPSEPPVVGIVGPFEAAMKGVPVALEAVRLLRASGVRAALHRVSQSPRSEAEAQFGSCEMYFRSLPVARMGSFYRGLDVLLFASEPAEGWGLPPLEAMATGVPVVVTDIPSLRELPCGSTLRVAVGDARGLAQGARDLLLDPARWREQRSRGLAAAKAFSVSRAVDVVESVLASL
ncbi:MAG: glycosyltransferase family 4 protein [Thermoanaerobaculia bacterium]